MTCSSNSKKCYQSDLDYDSEDDVRDELPSLNKENEHLASCLIIVMTCLERPRR
jgi:hypothetical protein